MTSNSNNHTNDDVLSTSLRSGIQSTTEFVEDGEAAADSSQLAAHLRERMTLARKENTTVAWLKGLVFAVLMMTAVAVSVKVYVYTHNDQKEDFKHAFEADASRVMDSFHRSVERTLEAVDALSVALTSHAKSTGATWPNVTLPDFAVRSANIRVLSGTVLVHYHPLVTDETRDGWEAYTRENRQHLADDYQAETSLLASQDALFQGDANRGRLLQFDEGYNDQIENLLPNGTTMVAPPQSGPFLPLWQVSPVVPTTSHMNFNVFSHPTASKAYQETIATGQAVIDAAANLNGENLAETGRFFELILSLSQYRESVREYLGEPVSGIGYPVFDSFDLRTRKVVGLIATSAYWRLSFENILPSNTRGIICVIENTLGQSFTYRIDAGVKYEGNGDLHDRQYSHLGKHTDVASFLKNRSSPVTKALTSVDLNTKLCGYKLHVYPSKDNEDVYVNRYPMKLSIGIAGVFVFTSLIFVMYTVAVYNRQQIVMDRAVASSAIVSSLFPSQVREQIYKENEVTPLAQSSNKAWLKREAATELTADPAGRPIAELFENTTIMFADMVGFTKWSSSRQPVQVFELLETIYKAFDATAVRRKVFKVETIGDCYVAVAGLPDPQEDHALIMVKFADDCMSKMRQLTTELALVLGADTAELAMRVGLHSGSVTGGVLRGQKSRFQLFGDAMNTAARMESNGTAGRIHASQETVDELLAKGKANWVAPRADKIVAKGKGELQTYWVTPRGNTGSVVSAVQSGSDEPEADAKPIRRGVETVEL